MIMGTVNINRSPLIPLFLLFFYSTFKAKSIPIELPVKMLFQEVATGTVSATKETVESMEVNTLERKSALKKAQFVNFDNMALQEIETEQISHVLQICQAVHTYAMKDGQTQRLFTLLHRVKTFPVIALNGAQVLPWIPENKYAKAHTPYDTNVLTAFETQLHFYGFALISR